MNIDTLLLRQIHPNFVKEGRISSQAFRPTPKDEKMLSVDNGDIVSPVLSYERFTQQMNCKSVGVMAVLKKECDDQSSSIHEDMDPYPEHCSIDFSGISNKLIEMKAKILRNLAQKRGWLYQEE
ncbi:hypothetical protein LLG10_04445 [bacterium]|nr:hypothetical protein [bacterium]